MGLTKFNELDAAQARVYLAGDLPTAPSTYYDNAANDVDSTEWKGGEMAFNTRDNRFYIQTATSSTTAVWKRYLDILT